MQPTNDSNDLIITVISMVLPGFECRVGTGRSRRGQAFVFDKVGSIARGIVIIIAIIGIIRIIGSIGIIRIGIGIVIVVYRSIVVVFIR